MRTPAVAVVAECKGRFGRKYAFIGPPARRGGSVHSPPQSFFKRSQAQAHLAFKFSLGPMPHLGLPSLVVPGVQADFMPGRSRLAHEAAQFREDAPTRPGRAGQQNFPPIQGRGTRTQHFPQKSRAQQTPEVAAHIVRPHAEKKGGLDIVAVEQFQQTRQPMLGAVKGVRVHSEAYAPCLATFELRCG